MAADTTSLIGKKFGRLTVIEFSHVENNKSYWKCVCDCGNICIKGRKELMGGNTKSCGCLRLETQRLNGSLRKKYNNFELLENNIVKVELSNRPNEYFICDADDWEYLKNYTWYKDDRGYVRSYWNGRITMIHDIIMGIKPEIKGGKLVCDHINRNRLDNRKCNLRVVTTQINAQNKSIYSNNTSGYTGIYLQHNPKSITYRATICDKHLGMYKTLTEARYARLVAERELFGLNPNTVQMMKLVDDPNNQP